MESYTEIKQIKVPTESSRLWKDECCYCFDTPENGEGLFIDLISLLSFSKKYVGVNHQKTNHNLYLNFKKIVIESPQKVTSSKSPISSSSDETTSTMDTQPPPKKLAIGVEGGFNNLDDEEIKYEEQYKLYLYPDNKYFELNDPTASIPTNVLECCEKIKTMNSQSRKEEIVSWNAESVFPSAYAESIIQIDAGSKRINPKGPWKCDIVDCDKKENLWLNLTDGFIGCGRKYSDGTGGNGHAQTHYDTTQYPISVKLGTITKDHADVYSYPEDDMVSDPLLFQHLTHWGLNPNVMVKTEKSMAELELDQNLNFEFGKIQEKGKLLENVYGPGLTGIENLGNSCYMSSVLQMLFSLDSFQSRYLASRETSFKDITQDPTASFEIQMSKLAHGLLSGDYSIPINSKAASSNANEESEKATQIGIAPKMFKSLIGASHPEFSTMHQQDALEYLQYLIEFIDRAERSRPSWISSQLENPTKSFQFYNEERIQCGDSSQVKYTRRLDNVLSVPVPMDESINKEQLEQYEQLIKENNGVRPKDMEEVRPVIPLISCLNGFIEPFKVDDFVSPATNVKTFSLNSSRMATFPETLIIHLKKYTYNADYSPKKLNVFMDVPDIIDIGSLRGNGIKEGEIQMKEGSVAAAAKPTYSQEVLDTLLSMDFPLVRCKKALTATGGKDAEAAMNWIFEHSEDPDIDVEVSTVTTATTNKVLLYNQEDVDNLINMGFSEPQAKLSLKNTNGNIERAADWLFSHMDNLEELVENDRKQESSKSVAATPAASAPTNFSNVCDGVGKYELLGFISHLGNNVQHGHYVCHIKKNGRWIKFNDRHVQLSENPPKELGYIYFYKRQPIV